MTRRLGGWAAALLWWGRARVPFPIPSMLAPLRSTHLSYGRSIDAIARAVALAAISFTASCLSCLSPLSYPRWTCPYASVHASRPTGEPSPDNQSGNLNVWLHGQETRPVTTHTPTRLLSVSGAPGAGRCELADSPSPGTRPGDPYDPDHTPSTLPPPAAQTAEISRRWPALVGSLARGDASPPASPHASSSPAPSGIARRAIPLVRLALLSWPATNFRYAVPPCPAIGCRRPPALFGHGGLPLLPFSPSSLAASD